LSLSLFPLHFIMLTNDYLCDRLQGLWGQRIQDLKELQQTKEAELKKYEQRMLIVQKQLDQIADVVKEGDAVQADVTAVKMLPPNSPIWVEGVHAVSKKSDDANTHMKQLLADIRKDLQTLIACSGPPQK
jgi:hypothetical protein